MARSFVLGIDCILYMQTAAQRASTPPVNPYIPADAGNFTELETVQDVTLNLSASTADLTNRRSSGWRQMVSTLKEGSADFTVLWQPDDLVFEDLLNAYLAQCPRAFLILDGPNTGMSASDTDDENRCDESGKVTGLYGDFTVSSFSRSEALEEGVTADATIELGVGLIYPEWISLDEIA